MIHHFGPSKGTGSDLVGQEGSNQRNHEPQRAKLDAKHGRKELRAETRPTHHHSREGETQDGRPRRHALAPMANVRSIVRQEDGALWTQNHAFFSDISSTLYFWCSRTVGNFFEGQ